MLEGQVSKHPLHRRHGLVPARFQHLPGKRERRCISCKRARRAAKQVARKLIEQNQQRERPRWRLRPIGIASGERRFDIEEESFANLRIEGRVLAEPDGTRPTPVSVGFVTEPESQNGIDC